MIPFRLGINSILYLLLSTTLAVEIAQGGCKTEVSKVTHEVNDLMPVYNKARKKPEVLEKELIEMLDLIYREREQEVEPKTVEAHAAALPPDPDNAALLYYQAFLLRPKPHGDTQELIYKVLRGAEPDEKVRKYLNLQNCQETIKLAEAAAQIPECNWGILYSQGFSFRLAQGVHLRPLGILLNVDARTLAADGDYRAALGRCLTIRRLASHIGDDMVILYAVSVSVDGGALSSIQHILGSMPPDVDILTWLQGQLAAERGAPQSPARALEMDFELALQTLRTNPDILARVRDQLAESTEDKSDKKKFQSLTDKELVAHAREPYADFLNSALRAMGSEMPYEEKYAELQRLTDELEEEFGSDPAAKQIITACAEQVVGMYGHDVRHTADFNALKAAIEIYLAVAKTGQLPDKLPDHLPKDPYSGQDFEYEKTKEGFVLRCRVKAIDEREVRQYEFNLQK